MPHVLHLAFPCSDCSDCSDCSSFTFEDDNSSGFTFEDDDEEDDEDDDGDDIVPAAGVNPKLATVRDVPYITSILTFFVSTE